MSKRFKILVVDDEPIDLQVISAALKDKYEVIAAQSGQEAIDLTRQHKPDLILLDVMMPEMSGYEVCSSIKSDAQIADIPIIFVTAFNTRDGEIGGLEAGAIDYVTKPIIFELLNLRVKNFLTMKEQRDLIIRQKEELEATLARIKQLEGIIHICMYCRKIKDDFNIWSQLEQYVTEHSEAQFSYGICPGCKEEKFPQFSKE